jgi:predicted transposase YbfD/YdcC
MEGDVMEGFVAIFSKLEDPRAENVSHTLYEIMLAALCACLCGFNDAVGIAVFAEHRLEFLRRYAAFDKGAPSHDTISRMFRLLDPKAFGRVFAEFMTAFAAGASGVLAVDGKTARHSFDTAGGTKPLHMVSAWASEMGLCLAQVATEEKSNEITAIPMLLDLLCLKGWVVTIDAMGTQRNIAEKIVEKEGDYVLSLKANQKTLLDDVALFLNDPERVPDGPSHTTVDADHGRVETRTATVSIDVDWLNESHKWPGLKAIGKIERTVVENGKTRCETAYHLLSFAATPERYGQCVRLHWGVENPLHWILDMNMREDDSRSRKDNSQENQAILRRMALNHLASKKDRCSIKGRMRRCVLNNDYLANVLGTF